MFDLLTQTARDSVGVVTMCQAVGPARSVLITTAGSTVLDEIEEREDENPHNVDEVPVEPRDLHRVGPGTPGL